MISINLNAIQEWERVRRDTEPHTPDVDTNPGTEQPDRPEVDDGSHGVRPTRGRGRRRKRDEPDHEETQAYKLDIGQEEPGLAAPPDGTRAPIEPYQGTRVDEEA